MLDEDFHIDVIIYDGTVDKLLPEYLCVGNIVRLYNYEASPASLVIDRIRKISVDNDGSKRRIKIYYLNTIRIIHMNTSGYTGDITRLATRINGKDNVSIYNSIGVSNEMFGMHKETYSIYLRYM